MGDPRKFEKLKKAGKAVLRALAVAAGWLGGVAEKARRWIREQQKRNDAPTLLPLTPAYDPDRHQVYFGALEKALKKDKKPVLNIALTGSYGVGKSSILQEVTRRHKRKVISISLSTLGFADKTARAQGDEATTKTNQIQKEIVKHLLYGEDPVKMPGSRYRRMTRFRFWRELGFAALLATPITVVFYLTGWTALLAQLAPLPDDWHLLIHGIVMAGLLLVILGFRFAFHNKIQIDMISAGSTSISLSPTSATYFDEYLDEIVYFFEMIRRDIVIFEDIDRFDDAHIFETLRSLNSTLNSARQTGSRRIRFVYAIKDSIFDELGARAAAEEFDADTKKPAALGDDDAALAEVARANRTKFFDLVIPVVPFITHRSARDLIVGTMKDLDHDVSNELIDLAARHVADMRLIKNIRNEFAIFKRLVIDTGDLDLEQDKLFAMMLYKSTHLSDFELIKLGKSDLDELYRDGRALVLKNVGTQNATMQTSRTALARVTITADHSKALGSQLLDHIKITLFDRKARNVQGFSLNNNAIQEAELGTTEFWEALATSDGTLTVPFISSNGYQETLDLTRAKIEGALGQPISSAVWAAAERARLGQIIVEARSHRDFLTHADMGALAGRPEYTLSGDGKGLTFAGITKDRLKSELAIQLVSGGYIDRNFTMYTSTFYGERISANATNYILKHVDPNTIDMFFPLAEKDVDDIIREKGLAFLGTRSGFNVSLLDHLLLKMPESAEPVAGRIMTYGEEEQEFLFTYLEDGSQGEELVRNLAIRWPQVLAVLTDAKLDAQNGRRLLDVALQNLSESTDYVTNDLVRDSLLQHFDVLAVFTSEETTTSQAGRLVKLLKLLALRLPSLHALGAHVLRAVVDGGSYVLNRQNLVVALGRPVPPRLSLDAIAEVNAAVHGRVLGDLDEYLAELDDGEVTVEDSAEFETVINDVADADEAHLEAVIARTDATCRVEDLTRVSSASWPALAKHQRFPATFTNMYAYLIEEIGIDHAILKLLEEAGAIDITDGPDEPAKVELALAILGAKQELRSAETRVRLAGTLLLEDQIPSTSIPAEPGELIGHLIEQKIVADTPDTFAAIAPTDVEGLAFAIGQSSAFLSFMSPTQVSPANVAAVIGSSIVPIRVRDAIAQRFPEFTAGAIPAALTAVAWYAKGRGITIAFDQIARLATEHASSSLIVELLGPHLASLSAAELGSVLRTLDGRYPDLAEPNGKHPSIPNTPADRALLQRLYELGIVSTFSDRGGKLRVNMRQI